MKFKYSTQLQLALSLREKFKTAKGRKAAKIAELFLSQPDSRLKNVFGLTQQQVDSLKIRLQIKVDKYNALQLVEGE